MKNIGDVVWIARLRHREFQLVCPDCLGTKAVTLLLENGERESLECKTCYPGGYEPPRGFITKTQYQPAADKRSIEAMEVSAQKTTYRFFDWSCNEVFETEQEAVTAAEALRKEREDEDHKRFVWKKEDARRSWSWECSYHRKQIESAEKQIAYAKAKLTVAKAMVKSPVKGGGGE